jgi:UDP-N-acetylmuramate--alanine ligase
VPDREPLAVPEVPDLDVLAHVFVANVGGAGMSAVATLLAERGHRVSGHDPAPTTPFVPQLEALGVAVQAGPDPAVLPEGVDAVVVSTATPADAPEVVAAHQRGIPVLHRKQALAGLCADRQTIAVAGTHGKTTTSAMLATVLVAAGLEPGWVVGAPIPGLGRSAAWGGAGPLVVEADESDGTFLALPAAVALITNVEPDHLEHYGDFNTLVKAFEQFLEEAVGPRFVGGDDDRARALGQSVGATTVGEHADADLRMVDVRTESGGMRFGLVRQGTTPADVDLPVPGRHNARNAALALAAAEAVGVPLADGAKALAGYVGVGRRFETRGRVRGATLIDDYAHLPTEVRAALEAAQSLVGSTRPAAGETPSPSGWRRVVCVFQPHRYSRTQALGHEFADAFGDADVLAVTDVYAAGEAPRPGVSGKLVVDAVLEAHPWKQVAYLPRLDDVVRWLAVTLRPGDLCLTLGAGDLTTVPTRLVAELGDAGGPDGAGAGGDAGTGAVSPGDDGAGEATP